MWVSKSFCKSVDSVYISFLLSFLLFDETKKLFFRLTRSTSLETGLVALQPVLFFPCTGDKQETRTDFSAKANHSEHVLNALILYSRFLASIDLHYWKFQQSRISKHKLVVIFLNLQQDQRTKVLWSILFSENESENHCPLIYYLNSMFQVSLYQIHIYNYTLSSKFSA